MNSVFVIATFSISAIGEQKNLKNIYDDKANLINVSIPAENKSVLYFPIKTKNLLKTFDEMISLLSTQITIAIKQADLTSEELKGTVLFLGSTSLDISCFVPDDNKAIWLSKTDKLSKKLAELHGLNAIHYTFNTACTSSANALIYAAQLIKYNKIKHAIVIGCEFYNQLSISGFDSLDLFSITSVKPFSERRDGLILGEGVGVVVLSNQQKKSTVLKMLGGYSSCDDFSLTITDEDGKHITEVVERALVNAQISLHDIDLIKIHGTASKMSDLAEYNAITRLFNRNENNGDVKANIIGFKSFLGHTLGACGVLELAILEDIFQKGTFPQCKYQPEEPNHLLYPFVQSAEAITSSKYLLLNHFGFGGNNAAIILKNINPTHIDEEVSHEFKP